MEYLHEKFLTLFPATEDSTVTLPTTTPGLACLTALRDNNIFCCPVVNADHEDRIEGLLSMVDICAYVVKLFDTDPSRKSVKFDTLFEDALRGSTADYSKMNDCYPLLSESSTFKDVMKALSQPGVHRVPMTGKAKFRQEILGQKEKRPLERFFTQSDLLRFVASNLDSFGDIVDKSVGDRLGSRPVFCVSEGVKVIEAFRELVSRKVTALGVVDDKGLLIGNISVRDMRYVVKQTPGAELVAPLDEFYTQVRKANPEIPKDVIACKEDETVKSVIVKLDSNHIHRIYIIDDEQKPVGVISLGDIFQYLLDNLK